MVVVVVVVGMNLRLVAYQHTSMMASAVHWADYLAHGEDWINNSQADPN